ncbi:aryl-sulfate sulfotransferase [Pseudotenacibaculum sp. MALMAid0570]|uniref:aryl-sulfate sulfotransferase n=1 Tax=Pseudotenacibaculum sp. MALMAid0570 TaxID=3143938 RepID=UPI0032DFAE2E
MTKKLLFIFLFACFSAFSQNTVGTISVTNDAYDGLTLFSSNTKTFLINNCGQIVNEWTSTYLPGHSVYILPNGNLIRAGRKNTSTINFGGVGGIVEMFDWDGNLIWEFDYSTDQHRLHHDIYPMPNGNILVLAATRMTNAEAIQAGRDSNFLVDGDLYNERILEIEPVGSNGFNIVWEWNINDHLIQDLDNTKDNFGVVADHPEKLDINFLNGLNGGANWLHINSIQYNEDLDQIVLSSRNLSELWIIDHSTTTAQAATGLGGTYGKGGDLLYRWGNPQSYDHGTETDRKLYGQHFPHFIPSGLQDAGKIILFNNGNGRTPNFSEVMIIDPPMTSPGVYPYTSNVAYGPANTDFTYSDSPDFFSSILSSAVRLPNGNILVCEGASGHFFELDAMNNIVWDYILPMNNTTGAITAQGDPTPTSGNSTFRAIKYAMNYVGFTGRDLTPGNPIETNFNLDPCNTLSNDEASFSAVRVYPNPVEGSIHIQSTLEIDRIEVYNVLGKKVGVKYQTTSFDMSSFNQGIYILKMYSGEKIETRKIIKK